VIVETDIAIIGGGITAAMVAEKLAELQPSKSVVVIETGTRRFDVENRFAYRQRNLDYGENAWPGDFVGDQGARGLVSRTMAVGGSALHWGGVCNRFSEEDTRLHSMYGRSSGTSSSGTTAKPSGGSACRASRARSPRTGDRSRIRCPPCR
jgi:quinoprotein glucose dehydrogenase